MKIFHIAERDRWDTESRSGSYTASTLGQELCDVGFIHCSLSEQVRSTLMSFYRDRPEPLVLLTIETDLLDAMWRFDPVPVAGEDFPHLYGALNVDAVVQVAPIDPSTYRT